MPLLSVPWIIEHLLHARHCPGYRDMSGQEDVMCTQVWCLMDNTAGQSLYTMWGPGKVSWKGGQLA